MPGSLLRSLGVALIAAALSLSSIQAQAAFPERPIRIVSPFAAGSVSDITLRLLADRLAPRLKTPVVIENMPTGGGITAARTVLGARADGHTLALLSNATAVTSATFRSLPFDPSKDFIPISGMSAFAYLFLASEQSGFEKFSDFLAAARAKPGVLNVGTAAPGTTPHLMAVLLKKEAGIDFTIVTYRGAADLTVALLRGDIDVFINAYGAVRESLAQKKLKPIATTTESRIKPLPAVPTVAESGVKDYIVSSWNGLYAPAGTPPEVIDQLGAAIRDVLAEPDIAKRFSDLGLEIWPAQKEELVVRMSSEIERWNSVVEQAGIERK